MGTFEAAANATELALADSILTLLAARAQGATICPSEAARAVHAAQESDDPDGWRELMDPARAAASRLASSGQVEITQGGVVVDLETARGPIRIRRVRSGS